MRSSNYKLHIVDDTYEVEFEEGVRLKVLSAKHFDVISDMYSVGFLFECDQTVIIYTGDTGVNDNIIEKYENIQNDYKSYFKVLLANLGGFKLEERANHFYENHLGRLGLVTLNSILKPEVCLISEFGEEFRDFRIEFADILQKRFDEEGLKIKFLSTDIGLIFLFDKDNKLIKGATGVDKSTGRIYYENIPYQEIETCSRVQDFSLPLL